ncbi:MAG: hypothetical protein ACI4QS_01060 [Comamonas sp.]
MSTQNFQVDFFTIGEFAEMSQDDVTRQAHIDIGQECLPIAASLQSARQWLVEQHANVDLECAAELPVRGYFSFQSSHYNEGFHVESAQLVAIDEGFVLRATLGNGVCVETDVLALSI